jgi:hypothetical protein
VGAFVYNTITQVPAAARGQAVLAASHGGLYPASLALRLGLGAVILHDAGFGRDQAGISGARMLETWGVPAAAVSHRSARIGDGADCFQRGVLSFVNERAAQLGLRAGQAAADALALLQRAKTVVPGGRVDVTEARRPAVDLPGVIVADSNSLVTDEDSDIIFVTGSHGGLLGGRPETAIKSHVFAAVYNDADGGVDEAGWSRLPALDARGIAAVTVSAWSARIGDANSTLEEGYVTHSNARAVRLGAEPGLSLRQLVLRLREERDGRARCPAT